MSETIYRIRDADGRLVANHHRVDLSSGEKKIWWMRPNGEQGLNRTRLDELPLYGSELLHNCDPDDLTILVEGKKAQDALQRANLPSVGTVCGAGVTPGEGSDTFLDVEHLLGSSKADTLTGSGVNNKRTGRGGSDTERGGLGNDTVIGSGGADNLFGEDGDDTVNSKDGMNGNDSLDGGSHVSGDTTITDATEKSIVGFP